MAGDEQSTPASPGDSELTTRTSQGAQGEHEVIGNYRLLEPIGVGGMGEVYRAEQTQPIRRTVALKVIKRGMDTREVMARFEAERQALALMDHPAIAKVFDAGSTPRGRSYFVMEYVRGIPIIAYCDEHRLSTHERLELFIQLCDGVQHAHQKAIIHRDLKPSNVLVTIQEDKPVPKIIDFGVAKATAQKLTEKTMYTALGEMIGTPEYMSPEQAAMTGEDVDTRTDVYSLGVILYELLVGALPFEPAELRKAGFAGMVQMIREQDPPRPSAKVATLGDREGGVARARSMFPGKLRSQLRGDLDWIIMRALEKDRTRRYGSPSDLAADVRRHLRHEPVLAGPPGAAYRARKFVRRHRLAVGVVSAAGLVLVGFALTMAVQAGRIARERDRADQQAETSDRVSEFLVSVFNVSDPGEARGNSITAREVLDNGAVRIQRELTDQPLLRAKMMDTMGRVYQNLGLYTAAESLLVGALELRKAQLGEKHLDTVESLRRLGWLRQRQGRNDEARSILERVLELRQRELGEEHVDTAWALYSLGSTLMESGELTQARELLERALPIFERELGPDHQAVAWCLNDLAVACGSAVLALPYNERALAIKERTLGPDHPDVGLAHNNLGNCLVALGRLEDARTHLDAARAILEKSLGPNHLDLASVLDSYGNLLRELGDYEGARSSLERSFRMLEVSVGPEHWAVPIVLRNLGLVAQDTGAYAKADSLFRRSLRLAEATSGAAWMVPLTLRDLARLAQEAGAYAEADSLFRRAVETGERLGAMHTASEEHARTLELYSALLRDMGQVEAAVTMEVRAQVARENLAGRR